VTFEAIIEDSRTREVEVRLECQPAVVVPVLEASGSFGSSARASRPDLRAERVAWPERVRALSRSVSDVARTALHAAAAPFGGPPAAVAV
jgi:hypothetical protein